MTVQCAGWRTADALECEPPDGRTVDVHGGLLEQGGAGSPAPGTKLALAEPDAPNQNWPVDFKGWFRTGDGVRCEPLTVTDGFSAL